MHADPECALPRHLRGVVPDPRDHEQRGDGARGPGSEQVHGESDQRPPREERREGVAREHRWLSDERQHEENDRQQCERQQRHDARLGERAASGDRSGLISRRAAA